MRILLEAYGCTLNRGEAAEFREAAIANGQIVVEGTDDYDVAALFTCCVIQTTQNKMLKRISQLSKAGKPITVCGCLGAVCESEILKIAPDARIFLPSEHISAAESMQISEPHPDRASIPKKKEKTDSVGILPIATGCIGECTYCVTRLARGQLKSRSIPSVLERAKELVKNGFSELQMTAQDTGIYGQDIEASLPELLNSTAAIEGDFMIRVGMMTPSSISDILEELVMAYAHRKIFKFFHLPVQSGDDDILNVMGRKYTIADFLKIVKVFRQNFPDITLSTDIIVGFPGETDENFQNSLELIKKTRPDIVNITRFSPRPGTAAAEMDNKIHGRVAKERSRKLTELRFELSSSIYEERVGREEDVLATEYRKPGTTFLRTRSYKPVVINQVVELGKWYTVRVIDAAPTHMIAELCI